MKVEISVILPIFNEKDSIEETIKNIKNALKSTKKSFEIIAVDDGSTDGSDKILKNLKIKYIRHEQNKGYGAALKTGILAAKGKWIFIVDCDGTYPVEKITEFMKYTKKYDMIVGNRKKKNISLLRKPAKWFLNKLANYLCGTKIPDLNSGMRLFKKDIAMRFFSLFPDGFSFTTTITIACLTNGYSVHYIPIEYYKRRGKSSINPIKDFINFINLTIRMVLYFKPLNVFIPFSIVLFLIGFSKALRDFVIQNSFGSGSVMIMLTAVQIAVLGMIADLITKRTKL